MSPRFQCYILIDINYTLAFTLNIECDLHQTKAKLILVKMRHFFELSKSETFLIRINCNKPDICEK
jgi:hypothetical protein